MRILIIFLDGVGTGEHNADYNPFARVELPNFNRSDTISVPLDALLGVRGLPQSGTGQTALLTGINAAEKFGRHFGPWVPTSLRPLLAEQNVLTRAVKAKRKVAFANAYPEEIFQNLNDRRLNAGPPLAALGAKVLNRHTPALMSGDAVASEITNEGWREHLNRTDLPVISAAQAGVNLARVANAHDLTLFAHYSTDYIGHRNDMQAAVGALKRVDDFLGSVLDSAGDDLTTFVVSDHGNIEDVRAGHTTNPALGMVHGTQRVEAGADLKSLLDIAPRVMRLLNIP